MKSHLRRKDKFFLNDKRKQKHVPYGCVRKHYIGKINKHKIRNSWKKEIDIGD